MNQQEYEAEKVRLKAKKKHAGNKLQRLSGPAYASAIRAYDAACEKLEALYRNNVGPQPTREERRREFLVRRGIKMVWN